MATEIYGVASFGVHVITNTSPGSYLLRANPSVTSLANGSWMVGFGDGEVDLEATVWSYVGNPLYTGYGNLNSTTSGAQRDVDLAALTGGGAVAAFTDFSSGTAAIRARRLNDNKTPIGADFVVSTGGDGGAQADADTAGLKDGGFVVVWEDEDSATSHDVLARIYEADGRIRSATTILAANTGADERTPHVAALADGGFVVVWTEVAGSATDLYAQRFDAAGAPAGGRVVVNTAGQINDQPEVIGLRAGGFAVAFRHDPDTPSSSDLSDVKLAVFNAAGTSTALKTVSTGVSAGSQFEPTLTEMANGYIAVGWSSSFSRVEVAAYTSSADLVAKFNLSSTDSSGNPVGLGDQLAITALSEGRVGVAFRNTYQEYNSFTNNFDSRSDIKIAVFDLLRTILGTDANEVLTVPDVIQTALAGLGGDDILYGGPAFDQQNGGEGRDQLFGRAGADDLYGENGDDVLNGGPDSDLLDGAAGVDTALYAGLTRSYTRSLSAANGTIAGGPEGGTDTLRSVEVVRFADGACPSTSAGMRRRSCGSTTPCCSERLTVMG